MGWTGPMRGIAPVAPKPLGAAAAVGLAEADAESRKYHHAVHDIKAMAAKSRRKDRRWRKPKSGKAKGRVQSSLANAACVTRMCLWSCLFHTGLCASVIGPPPVPVPVAAAFSSAAPSTASTLVSCSPLIVLVLVLLAIACGASWLAGRCGKGASPLPSWL